MKRVDNYPGISQTDQSIVFVAQLVSASDCYVNYAVWQLSGGCQFEPDRGRTFFFHIFVYISLYYITVFLL